jgi:hypothetical protein
MAQRPRGDERLANARTRKMLVFPEYPDLSSGIERQVNELKEEIADNQKRNG